MSEIVDENIISLSELEDVSIDDGWNDYVEYLSSELEKLTIAGGETAEIARRRPSEESFFFYVTGLLEQLGDIDSCEFVNFTAQTGNKKVHVTSVNYARDMGQLNLIVSVFERKHRTRIKTASLKEIEDAAWNLIDFVKSGGHQKLDSTSPERFICEEVFDALKDPETSRIRLLVLTNGLIGSRSAKKPKLQGFSRDIEYWDLERLKNTEASGRDYEIIDENVPPVPVLKAPNMSGPAQIYTGYLSGDLLADLYQKYGGRLMELNVRSFLQVKGKVNIGIRRTLIDEPSSFLAYNNGLVMTVESIETTSSPTSEYQITRLIGPQVVNGGQTVASIHRTKYEEKKSVADVYVLAKIAVIPPEHVSQFVPLVSRYANSQNKVNDADFSANHDLHVAVEKLSRTIVHAGSQTHYFYERARGQYGVEAKRGVASERKRFASEYPSTNRFDKVELAKVENIWAGLPHIVSRGNQKNYVKFISDAPISAADFDAEYYRRFIGKMLLFRHATKIARTRKSDIPSYQANVVAYTLALLVEESGNRIDTMKIWQQQGVPMPLAALLRDWMVRVYKEIVKTSKGTNVTEWCKKEKCWNELRQLDWEIPDYIEKEYLEDIRTQKDGKLIGQQAVVVGRLMSRSVQNVQKLQSWGVSTKLFNTKDLEFLGSMVALAADNWFKLPSFKQAKYFFKLENQALQQGYEDELADV